MSFFIYLAAFLMLRRIQTTIKFTELRGKWNSMLTTASWVLWVVFGLCTSEFEYGYELLIGSMVLVGLITYIKEQEDFKPMAFLVEAAYPLAGISFVNFIAWLVARGFYKKFDGLFEVSILMGFAWIFYRWANSKKQQEQLKIVSLRNLELDRMVAERTAELTRQRNELEGALEQLKTTQQQLIQSEKLASLGELTAGIAHEIQNPLNFVNNFSEVSIELIEEMEEELAKGDTEEAVAIANDIRQNLDKIRHHGKRADGIVKGMLQHSRASSNTKEYTNVNTLADEYLRLAYHGLRAKDKSFNAELVTNFDPSIPTVSIVPQDVGRVLLNMFNNAFYAVQQKQKLGVEGFKPTVEVQTIPLTGTKPGVMITVKDNGTGIPDEIRDKILQPFFTTKPTGEGTGLGLSLSYDIIVKTHGGTIDIESQEGEWTKFIITLPA